jgi:hypothetical protein
MTTRFRATRSHLRRLLLLTLCLPFTSLPLRTQITPRYARTNGALTNGHCAQFDASGQIVDAGVPCVGSTFVGPTPWFDIAAYGGNVRQVNNIPSATATTTAGSPTVALASAIDFKTGEGIVIWKAGAATTQNTPAAPTIISPVVTGSTTYQYECVGVDSMGGLSAASSVGQVTTGPAVFGAPQVTISSISQSSGAVTVNFSSAINASAGQQIIISDVTSPTTFNGLFAVASAPNNSQITYSLAGNAGAGRVSGNSKGRLVNAYNIKAISRSGNVVTVTTNANHNYLAPSAAAPSIVIIDGVTPPDLNGYFVVDSVTPNTITYHQGMTGNETGRAFGTATVYEYNVVTCPTISSPTVQYYVYGRTAGSMALIGKTFYKENTFRDYGPFWENGFRAPGYVPTTPPVSAQNQMFASTISSGAGTTRLTLAANVPSAVRGQTALHDDGQAIVAAANAAAAVGSQTVYLSPGTGLTSPPRVRTYVVNAPFTLPGTFTQLIIGTGLIVNETITLSSGNKIYSPLGSTNKSIPQFASHSYSFVYGMGNPMFAGTGSVDIEGMGFITGAGGGNGQNFLYLGGPGTGGFIVLQDDWFGATGTGNSASIPLVFSGASYSFHLTNVEWACNFAIDGAVTGQPSNGPPLLPCILLEATASGFGAPNGFHLDGMNASSGRGILADFSQYGSSQEHDYEINNVMNDQGPTNPLFAVYGQDNALGGVKMHQDVMDSHSIAVFANWAVGLNSAVLDHIDFAPQPNSPVTGLPITNLILINPSYGVSPGQNFNMLMMKSEQGINFGPTASTAPSSRGQEYQARPMRFSSSENYPLYWQISQPRGVTAVTSGAGSVPSGSHTYTVTAIGWNGGEVGSVTVPVSSATVTVNGSQGVLVSWTGISGVQGYTAYRDNSKVHRCINVQTTSCTDTFGFTDGVGPTADGTGLPLIDTTQVTTPLLRLTNGVFKVEVAAGTLTANRQITAQDASGTATLTIANGTATLGTSAINATSCATAVTAAASGTATTDSIEWAFNAAPPSGYAGTSPAAGLHVLVYVTSGNVNFQVCNPTAASITPAAATLNWRVVR